jgi:cytochrome c oxidase subunit 3
MMWFIFSEVMFFAAFFGALFYARTLSVPWLSGQGVKVFTNFILWPQYEGNWPTNGPGHVGGKVDSTFEVIPAFSLPAINTAILLTSGLTITVAHHALRAGKRGTLTLFLALTFILGFTFVGLQAHEYGEAYKELGLRLSTGIYGSTFFMLTGFHGLHVTIGAIMLLVIWLRVVKGHFTSERHFAFEAVAWYWHFVDVVWLGLFIFVYWL